MTTHTALNNTYIIYRVCCHNVMSATGMSDNTATDK